MKLYKKAAITVGAAMIFMAALYFFGTGFRKIGSVYIVDYEISSDGTQMTIHAGVSTSAGYIRNVSSHQKQEGILCLDFYAAFGGINGSIGAKSEYIIPLDETIHTIAVYRSNIYYEPVMEKNEFGEWQLLLRRE